MHVYGLGAVLVAMPLGAMVNRALAFGLGALAPLLSVFVLLLAIGLAGAPLVAPLRLADVVVESLVGARLLAEPFFSYRSPRAWRRGGRKVRNRRELSAAWLKLRSTILLSPITGAKYRKGTAKRANARVRSAPEPNLTRFECYS